MILIHYSRQKKIQGTRYFDIFETYIDWCLYDFYAIYPSIILKGVTCVPFTVMT